MRKQGIYISFLICAIMLFTSTISFGQQRTIVGTITDDKGAPLYEVLVKLQKGNISTNSDSNGKYSITIPEGTLQELNFSHPDMNTISVTVGIYDTLNVSMTPLGVDDFLIMSLEELMNMTITTVSKKEEKVSEAPAIVTVITQEQFHELGIQATVDIMKYVPGFNVYDNYWKPDMVSSRGAKPDLYNNKILMLINGLPAYDGMTLEFFMNLVPISSIERLEIIRGPGSTLYGTNAFSGVINVITKDGRYIKENSTEVMTSFRYGSFLTRELNASVTVNQGKLNYHLGVTARNDEGYKKTAVGELGVEDDITYEDDINSFYANINYGDITVATGGMFNHYGKFGPLPRHNVGNYGRHIGGRTDHQKLFAHLVYEKEISDILSLNAKFRYDWANMQGDVGALVDIYEVVGAIGPAIDAATGDTVSHSKPTYIPHEAHTFGGEVQFALSPFGEVANLNAGISFEQRRLTHLGDLAYDYKSDSIIYIGTYTGEGDPSDPNYDPYPFVNYDLGGYLQVDGKFTKLGYVAGIRLTYLELSEQLLFTPRLGLVFNYNKSGSLKTLYGEAFRGAGPHEHIFRLPQVVWGPTAINAVLEPEKIKTFEVAWDHIFAEKVQLRLNGFYNIIDGMIKRDVTTQEEKDQFPILGGARVYRNVTDAEFYGMEGELKIYMSPKFNIWANTSFKEEASGDLYYIEKVTANVGMNIPVNDKIFLRPNIHYVGPKEGELTNGTKVEVEQYALVNLILDYNVSKAVKFSLQGLNLFDKEYFYPEDVRRGIPTIPGGPGAAIFGSVTWNFGL